MAVVVAAAASLELRLQNPDLMTLSGLRQGLTPSQRTRLAPITLRTMTNYAAIFMALSFCIFCGRDNIAENSKTVMASQLIIQRRKAERRAAAERAAQRASTRDTDRDGTDDADTTEEKKNFAPPPRRRGRPDRGPRNAKKCPWCFRWALKDQACNHVICGVDTKRAFVVGHGCGRQFCFLCGKKLCARIHNPDTGKREPGRTSHTAICCAHTEPDFDRSQYCPGGHNSHCPKRW